MSGRQWTEGPNAGRLRLRIVHPMDTGLVAGTPAFHLEEINFTDAAGKRLASIQEAAGAVAIRIALKKGGCAGMEYTLDPIQTVPAMATNTFSMAAKPASSPRVAGAVACAACIAQRFQG